MRFGYKMVWLSPCNISHFSAKLGDCPPAIKEAKAWAWVRGLASAEAFKFDNAFFSWSWKYIYSCFPIILYVLLEWGFLLIIVSMWHLKFDELLGFFEIEIYCWSMLLLYLILILGALVSWISLLRLCYLRRI